MDLEKENTAKFLKTGDRQAFQWLFLKYEAGFRHYADILTNGNGPDDLIQLTCLQMLEYDGRHKDPAKFYFNSFFSRSIHNTFIDQYRKRKPVYELLDYLDYPDRNYIEHSMEPLIRFSEILLTEDQKKVMYYRMKGIKFKHIAKKMGISPNTATGLFRYGRMKLQNYREQIFIEAKIPA